MLNSFTLEQAVDLATRVEERNQIHRQKKSGEAFNKPGPNSYFNKISASTLLGEVGRLNLFILNPMSKPTRPLKAHGWSI